MALVCDIESAIPAPAVEELPPPVTAAIVDDNDLEDGEIEDDGDDEDVPMEAASTATAPPSITPPKETVKPAPTTPVDPNKSEQREQRNRHERDRRRHDDKKKHMTEAEKSILHLRRREKMQREKWEKFRKEQNIEAPVVDDFASNIEKAIASVLKKDSKQSDEEKDDGKRDRKRKIRDKDRVKGGKQRKMDSPNMAKSDDLDDNEFLNMRGGGSPGKLNDDKSMDQASPRSDDSYDSEYSSDRSKGEDRRNKRDFKKGKGRNRDRNKKRSRDRERRNDSLKDTPGLCLFYLQGQCQKNDCPYSHDAVTPMKLELCKFYLKDCCAKGEKCSYMHSEFPCKFYHTGLQCVQGDNCKFAHGKPLTENLKQILYKHIETAPREILGGFPRMSREEALNMINATQSNLMAKFGMNEKKQEQDQFINQMPNFYDINVAMPPEFNTNDDVGKAKSDRPPRNRPSRWQDPDPKDKTPAPFIKPFVYQDQDMRINSNGDIDMRTLPPLNQQHHPTTSQQIPPSDSNQESTNFTQDIDIRNPNMLQFDTKDVDIRQQPFLKDVDIRQIPPVFEPPPPILTRHCDDYEENELQIDTGDDSAGLPANLPKTQRDLFMRIQAQQKTNLPEQEQDAGFNVDENINWYSDDDDEDENRLTIKVDNEDEKKESKDDETSPAGSIMSPPQFKPQEVVEKLGDLSKIDISAEVTKLLTSITQSAVKSDVKPTIRDPRCQSAEVKAKMADEPKLSIYEQGGMDVQAPASPDEEVGDVRARPDVDLRTLNLPFKGMLNYTPATEIDASIKSHPPIQWHVHIVDVPRPDYTGLKLNVQDAEKTGDPRLRKIFRLSVDEKDSPASPKASPKASGTVRIDPRLKKTEDVPMIKPELSYNQQLNILQSSAFFQSLTSNQKVLLNQELAARNEQSGAHDPLLHSLLTNLNLVPNSNISNPTMGAALSILANVNKLNPIVAQSPVVLGQNPNIMNQMAQSMVQPGLLGAAPGIPNMAPPDFPMNFDPRNGGGLLGNGPGPFVGNFQDNGNFGNYDDYYQQDNGVFNNGGNNNRERNFNNRDRRRGRNNFNRNCNRNFRNRNNRNNRSHTPP